MNKESLVYVCTGTSATRVAYGTLAAHTRLYRAGTTVYWRPTRTNMDAPVLNVVATRVLGETITGTVVLYDPALTMDMVMPAATRVVHTGVVSWSSLGKTLRPDTVFRMQKITTANFDVREVYDNHESEEQFDEEELGKRDIEFDV